MYLCMYTYTQNHGKKLHSIDSCVYHHNLWSITTNIHTVYVVVQQTTYIIMYVNGSLFSCRLAMHDLYTVCTYIRTYVHS